MILKYIRSTGKYHWNNRTFGFLCNFKGTFFEWKKGVRVFGIFVSCTLREDADGNTGFHLINSGQNDFQSLFEIFTV